MRYTIDLGLMLCGVVLLLALLPTIQRSQEDKEFRVHRLTWTSTCIALVVMAGLNAALGLVATCIVNLLTAACWFVIGRRSGK